MSRVSVQVGLEDATSVLYPSLDVDGGFADVAYDSDEALVELGGTHCSGCDVLVEDMVSVGFAGCEVR